MQWLTVADKHWPAHGYHSLHITWLVNQRSERHLFNASIFKVEYLKQSTAEFV
jgi:hypothetical protein